MTPIETMLAQFAERETIDDYMSVPCYYSEIPGRLRSGLVRSGQVSSEVRSSLVWSCHVWSDRALPFK